MLARELAVVLLTPVDLVLSVHEQRLEHVGERPSQHPIVLVVGPPRAGTTLVYQTLAHHLPFSFFNNLSSLFPRSPITACKAFNRFLPSGELNADSYYGNTVELGAPNDGFHVWNRWLGEDRYHPPSHLSVQQQASMRSFFNAWNHQFDRPFLNKNNRNMMCLELLDSTLDNVTFIVVKRDPFYVAQSLLKAREDVQGDRSIGWGAGADDGQLNPAASPLEQVADQTRRLYEQLEMSERRVPAASVVDVQYEQFCRDPTSFVCMIRERVWGAQATSDHTLGTIAPFHVRNEDRLSEGEANELRRLLEY